MERLGAIITPDQPARNLQSPSLINALPDARCPWALQSIRPSGSVGISPRQQTTKEACFCKSLSLEYNHFPVVLARMYA